MEKTQVRLAEELSEVCRDYCNVTWDRAMTVVGVPVNSVWRLPESVYYHLEICEVLAAISSPPAPAPKSSE